MENEERSCERINQPGMSTKTPESGSRLLDSLRFAGITLDDDLSADESDGEAHGRLVDWTLYPPKLSHPLQDRHVKSHELFTKRDDDILAEWIRSARLEHPGWSEKKIFQQLHCYQPQHSRSAWQTRYLKSIRPADATSSEPTTLLEQARSPDPVQEPGLASGQILPSASTLEADDGHRVSQNQVHILKNVYSRLGLNDEAALQDFIVQPWMMAIYDELAEAILDRASDRPPAVDELGGQQLATSGDSLPNHKEQVKNAVRAIEGRLTRYLDPAPDKSSWRADEHSIRFIVRVVEELRSGGGSRVGTITSTAIETLCESACFLLMWYRWLHRPIHGTGRSQQALAVRQRRYLSLLQSHRRTAFAAPPPPSVHNGTAGPIAEPIGIEDSYSNAPAGGLGRDLLMLEPTSHQHRGEFLEERGVSWLTKEALTIWVNRFQHSHSQWGASEDHDGTCILHPREWRFEDPKRLMTNFSLDMLPLTEADFERLEYTYKGVGMAWVRAAMWFLDWYKTGSPRRSRDVERFFGGQGEEQSEWQASHLCHHATCINVNHIVLEQQKVNLSRSKCKRFAYYLRQDGYAIKPYCSEPTHQPPCLLHHAAITMREAILIQFSLLRKAIGLPDAADCPRPVTHPVRLATFECKLPTRFSTAGSSIVTFDPQLLQKPPADTNLLEKAAFHCPYCRRIRKWTRIQGFYSHIRSEHEEITPESRVATIVQQTKVYLDYCRQVKYDHRSSNKHVWEMMVQTQLPDFCWDVLASWTLHDDRKVEVKFRQRQ